MSYKKTFRLIFAIMGLLAATFSGNLLMANDEQTEKFNPGELIIEHIIDSYGWHITTFGEHEISIPLPVILFDKGKPVVFMSNKFQHGHAAYKGYALGFTPETKGKIVRVTDANGNPITGEFAKETATIDQNGALLDVSITKNVCSLLISIFLLIFIFLKVAKQYKQRPNMAPKGLQSLLEPIILFVRDEVAIPSIGKEKYAKYLPYLLTLFFFILINNLMGLVPIFPGGANLTGNIVVTGILALITFFITSFSAKKSYWVHIINTPGVPWWLKIPLPLMPVVELIGVFTKPFVLMIRLFANITAGHIIGLGFIVLIFIFGQMIPALGYGVSVISLFFYLFMGLLELIVAFVQAFVFTLLTAIYIGMAIEEHAEHTEHEGVAEHPELETITETNS